MGRKDYCQVQLLGINLLLYCFILLKGCTVYLCAIVLLIKIVVTRNNYMSLTRKLLFFSLYFLWAFKGTGKVLWVLRLKWCWYMVCTKLLIFCQCIWSLTKDDWLVNPLLHILWDILWWIQVNIGSQWIHISFRMIWSIWRWWRNLLWKIRLWYEYSSYFD